MLSDMKLGKRNRQKQPGHEKKKMMHYQLPETESDPHRFFCQIHFQQQSQSDPVLLNSLFCNTKT